MLLIGRCPLATLVSRSPDRQEAHAHDPAPSDALPQAVVPDGRELSHASIALAND